MPSVQYSRSIYTLFPCRGDLFQESWDRTHLGYTCSWAWWSKTTGCQFRSILPFFQLVGSWAHCDPFPKLAGLTTGLIFRHGMQAEEIYGILRLGLKHHTCIPLSFFFPWVGNLYDLNTHHADKPSVLRASGTVGVWERRNVSSFIILVGYRIQPTYSGLLRGK